MTAPEHAAAAPKVCSRPARATAALPAAARVPSPSASLASRRRRRDCRFDHILLRATALTSDVSASLMRWLVEDRGMETPAAEPAKDGGLVARRAIRKGEVSLR